MTPRAGRDGIDGSATFGEETVLTVRVRAVPEDGAANDAVARLIAKALGVAPSAARVIAGHKARLKSVAVEGDPAALMDRAKLLWP